MRLKQLVGLGAAFLPIVSWAADTSLTCQARIVDPAGGPINVPVDVEVSLWSDAALDDAQSELWRNSFSVSPQDGYVSLVLDSDGSGQSVDTDWFADDVWVELRVGGEVMGTRQPLRNGPSAAHAATSGGVTVATEVPAVPCVDGAIVLDQSAAGSGVLRVCTGSTWSPAVADGLTPDTAAVDCNEIHTRFPAAPSGSYWIDPDGNGSDDAFPAYCDMTTADGGWTLCLNSAFTASASYLFDEFYVQIYPPNRDPYGFYDWCGTTNDEYLFSLADYLEDDTYELKTATVHMTDVVPYHSGGEWTEIGLRAPHSSATWIHDDSINTACTDSALSLALFQYVDPAYRGLRGHKRGFLTCTVASGNPGNKLVVGAGCNYGSCNPKGNYNPRQPWDSDVYPTYSAWTWRVVATAGNGNNQWTSGPIREDRTLVFYR